MLFPDAHIPTEKKQYTTYLSVFYPSFLRREETVTSWLKTNPNKTCVRVTHHLKPKTVASVGAPNESRSLYYRLTHLYMKYDSWFVRTSAGTAEQTPTVTRLPDHGYFVNNEDLKATGHKLLLLGDMQI